MTDPVFKIAKLNAAHKGITGKLVIKQRIRRSVHALKLQVLITTKLRSHETCEQTNRDLYVQSSHSHDELFGFEPSLFNKSEFKLSLVLGSLFLESFLNMEKEINQKSKQPFKGAIS